MSQQPSGWYDDPSDPDMLRYWDGVTWTSHTAPKKSPTASQSTIGLPQAHPQQPQAGQQGFPGANPYGQAPGTGHYPQAPANAQWMAAVKTTADGVPLASWGRRLGARIIDNIIVSIAALAIGWNWVSQLLDVYVSAIEEATRTGATPDPAGLQEAMASHLLPIAIVSVVVAVVYETAFLVARGATPGKMALGISVRRTGQPGALSVVDALRRQLIQIANGLLATMPFSILVNLVVLLDYLWPLWDQRVQALHDKIADTQVVVGQQPRKR